MSKQFANSVLISGANRGLGLQFVKILGHYTNSPLPPCGRHGFSERN